MARALQIEWAPGEKVTGRLAGGGSGDSLGVSVLLAHGAGAGQDHPFMVHIRDGLAAAGVRVLTFNYPYTEAGRRSPDRPNKLLPCHAAAADRLATYGDPVVLAGKSMGGRMGSHLAGDDGWPASGVIYYGYPLVAPGKRVPRDTAHLAKIAAPQLFFAGTRDPLGPLDLIEGVTAGLANVSVKVVEGGDHSFRVPKRTGLQYGEVLDRLVADTVAWLEKLV